MQTASRRDEGRPPREAEEGTYGYTITVLYFATAV